MAETTGIAWTDSTFNPWIGCTKVGPGCDHCYAEALDQRHRWGGATHWGPGVPRKRTSEAYWRQPLTWNRKAAESSKPWRVFCASLADVFDNEVPEEWRGDLWRLIRATPSLTWLLLTKRIGNVAKMHPGGFYGNVWIGATIVNQEEADRDVPKLLAVSGVSKRFVSYEPALGSVNWLKFPGIDWIIIGGESAQGGETRAFDIAWAAWTIKQARVIGAAPFVKQFGSRPQEISYPRSVMHMEEKAWERDGWTKISFADNREPPHWRRYYRFKDRAGSEPAEWPEHLRVQEFPA